MAIFLSGYLQIRPINTFVNKRHVDSLLNTTLKSNFVNKPIFKKCIIILIDALRYDYLIKEGEPYTKYLRHLQELYSTNKDGSSLLYKFVADPPTTTTQRLRALTVGSIPTFFEIKDVFSGSLIHEDNLLKQFNINGKKVVFLGDDTWLNLYDAKTFYKTYPFPSFVVKDLHTVDDGVISNIDHILNSSDWDIIITHFLGVDHCGHWLGIHHNEMKKKLQQMDLFINNITKVMDNDTLLLVFGDHGSTNTGDHGGESQLELESLLFGYSKFKTFMSQSSHLQSVPQIDLVPTLAMLLGVPIPYSNIGKLIPEFFGEPSSLGTHNHLAKLLHVNMLQVNQIMEFYKMNVDQNTTQALKQKYKSLANLLNEPGDRNEKDILKMLFQFNNETLDYLTSIQNMARKEWIEYNYTRLIAGLALLLATTITFLYALFRTTLNFVFNHRLKKLSVKKNPIDVGTTDVCILQYGLFKKDFGTYALILTLYLAPMLSLLSNSYIIHEASVNKFLLTSLLFLHLWLHKNKIPNNSGKKLLSAYFFAALLLRFMYSGGHEFSLFPANPRSDQVDKSKPEAFPASPSHFITTAPLSSWQSFIFCLKLLTLYSFLYTLYRLFKRFGTSKSPGLNRNRDTKLLVVPFLALAFFWTSEAVITLFQTSNSAEVDSLKPLNLLFNQKSNTLIALSGYLATRIVLLCPIVIIVSSWFRRDTFSDFQKVDIARAMMRFAPVVATLLMVMREGYAPHYACLCLLVFLWAFILDKNGTNSRSISSLFQADFRLTHLKNLCLNALICYSLGQYGFFLFGHQHELSSIKWDSAFQGILPGTSSFTNSNNSFLAKIAHYMMDVNKGEPLRFVSAYMIILNTFSSQITMIYLLPVLVLVPFRFALNVKYEGKDHKPNETFKKLAMDSLELSYLLFLAISHLKMLVSTFGIFIHRRHLMLWAIFFPRYIYATLEFFITAILFAFFM